MTNGDQAIGRALRRLRRASKLTQRELGAAMGYSAKMVSACEKGNRRLSLTHAALAAAALGCTLDALLASSKEVAA